MPRKPKPAAPNTPPQPNGTEAPQAKDGQSAQVAVNPIVAHLDALTAKHPGGRPSGYKPEFVEDARKLCSILSATDQQVAQFFGVSLRTIDRWKVEHEEFRLALKIEKGDADDRVERSLYQRATGYSFDSEKIFHDARSGIIRRVKTVEHVPPDVVACIFWLKNRRRDLWRDKHEVEHTGAGLAELIAQSGLEVPGIQAPHKAN